MTVGNEVVVGTMRAEFDAHAAEYAATHARNIAITGESPEFFHEYKVIDTRAATARDGFDPSRILDFGAGVGNSIPHFRHRFPAATLTSADASPRSLAIARERFPGASETVLVDEDRPLDLPDAHFDLVFSACVFHHIDHSRHAFWLGELRRVTRPGGRLFIFEHNPLNPLTVRAVNTCPFDENAVLIGAGALSRAVAAAGWARPEIAYRIFFPGALAALRPIERALTWLPLGAQYR